MDVDNMKKSSKGFLSRVFTWSGYGYSTTFKVIKETIDMLTLEVINTTLPNGSPINEVFISNPFALRNALMKGNIKESSKKKMLAK